MKNFKRQLIRILKDESFFGIADDGKYTLLYTQHFILSDKDLNAASIISDLRYDGYIKPDKAFTWEKYGIIPAEFDVPKNVVPLYHKFLDAPRSSAEYTLHSYTNELGDIIGNVFAVENDDNKVLAETYFNLFKNARYEFSQKADGVFIINNCHIITPIKVHRECGFKVVRMGGAEDEKD